MCGRFQSGPPPVDLPAPPSRSPTPSPAAEPAAKKVTWLELFFDLVFVYAVTRCSELVREDLSWLGLAAAVVCFVPVYWTWVGTTMNANLHDVDTAVERMGTFAVALCTLVMALGLPRALHEDGLLFAGGYWAARLLLFALVQGRENRRAFVTFTVGAFLTGPMLVVGALLDHESRLALWALTAVVDLGVPWLARRRLSDVPFDPGHLTERYGTLVIIALGEMVVATAGGAEVHDGPRLATLVAAFVVACGLWWVYFAFGPDVIEAQLAHSRSRIDLIRPVLSYGHLALIAGIIGVAAAIGEVVADPGGILPLHIAALLFGGAALYLVTFAFTRWRLVHTLAVPRLVAVLACLVLLAFSKELPGLASLGLLAAVLVVLNVVEARGAAPHAAPLSLSAASRGCRRPA